MELRHLRFFIAVAEELNFSRAAKRLHITQPPLSMQIQNLETEIGVLLFHRTNRRVELTEAGQQFYQDAIKIIDSLKSSIENTQRIHSGKMGAIRVGFVGSATYDILPAVLRELRQQFPDIQIHLSELSTIDQIEALRQDKIDVGVIRPPILDDTLQTEIVSIRHCVLAVPKQHPLLDLEVITLNDLKPYPFVLLSSKTWPRLHTEILSLCQPIIQQEALEFQTVIGLVAAGIGISVVPQSAMNIHTKEVVYIDSIKQLPLATMGITYRSNNQSILVNAFCEIAKRNG